MGLRAASREATDTGSEKMAQSPLWEKYREEGFAYERPKRGDLTTGTIAEIGPRAIWVDIGVKRDGLVPEWDLRKLDDRTVDALEVGTEVPVFIVRPRNRKGDLIVSISSGKQVEDWKEAERLLDTGDITEHEVESYNKGGVVVSFGQLLGFVPASHLDGLKRGLCGDERREALSGLVGEMLPLKVIDVERRRRRLVLSHREAMRERKRRRKAELLEELAVGDVRTGRVRALLVFGAFVDIGGADGLVHVSEVSHERVGHPREKLVVGQEVIVSILRLDHRRKRIGLSIKRLLPDPWENAQSRYHTGQVMEATVTNVVDFGAFATLEEGLEGLIHVSQMSHVYVDHPSDVVSAGDTVTVRIVSMDLERQRIGLSLREAPQWIEVPAAELLEQDSPAEPEHQHQEPSAEPACPRPDAPLQVAAEVVALPT